MTTITLSTAYASFVTDNISSNQGSVVFQQGSGIAASYTGAINADPDYGSLLHIWNVTGVGGTFSNGSAASAACSINFKDSSNNILTQYTSTETGRTVDTNGYVVISNFPQKTPVAAGTITTIEITGPGNGGAGISLTVGAVGSGTDVEVDDRVLVTTQPWRLDGSIKFRVPTSYTWSV
jgi:hypothetical protein